MVANIYKKFCGVAVFLLFVVTSSANVIAGDTFPSFSLFDPVDGVSVESTDYAGRTTLLIFFANVEDIEQSQMRMVSGIQERYADKDITIAVVCMDPDEAGVLRIMVKAQPSFKILIPGKGASIVQGNTMLPTFLLLNADLGIVKKIEGKEDAKLSLFEAVDKQLLIGR